MSALRSVAASAGARSAFAGVQCAASVASAASAPLVAGSHAPVRGQSVRELPVAHASSHSNISLLFLFSSPDNSQRDDQPLLMLHIGPTIHPCPRKPTHPNNGHELQVFL